MIFGLPLFVQRMKGLEGDSCKRRVSGFSHQLLSGDYYLDALDAHSNANLIEVKSEFIRLIGNLVSISCWSSFSQSSSGCFYLLF